ncbi:MAG: hypothetical protein ABDI07_12220, partial [Candidatus Kryptonium sp.]
MPSGMLSVSIPHRFDSNPALMFKIAQEIPVSIPHRFDSNPTLIKLYSLSIFKLFQSLTGTIQTMRHKCNKCGCFSVSIPHRYDSNRLLHSNPRTFDGVSIPHRFDSN